MATETLTALAAALPTLDHACGLGTVGLFQRDVTDVPLRPSGGSLPAGVRPVPDPSALDELAVPPARQAWWVDRLTRCLALLRDGEGRP